MEMHLSSLFKSTFCSFWVLQFIPRCLIVDAGLGLQIALIYHISVNFIFLKKDILHAILKALRCLHPMKLTAQYFSSHILHHPIKKGPSKTVYSLLFKKKKW